ncbi:MAG TPA: SAM-dependent chlorinase/fluorinase, partial [Desulfobaccales bacterium]|nr:SAM-dependent chlorinase/fluorinase [Desulfobaccales bacterium]
ETEYCLLLCRVGKEGFVAASRPLITLLTDFGTRDAYVGSMKGVILGLNPGGNLIDLSHEVPPQDIRAGALILAAAAPFFPPGATHLAVVDPGVGSGRRALAARARDSYWVGPDNGLFHFIFDPAPDLIIVSLENPAYFRPRVSATFHGRDIFAPVAAHLSLGVHLERFGPRIADPVLLDLPQPVFGPALIRAEIIAVDHFGNLVSNLRFAELTAWLKEAGMRLTAGPLILTGLARTYAEVAPGEFLALEGSHGFLEIACARDSAARRLKAGAGLALEIRKA